MPITFSTCWYSFKNKFSNSDYEKWIHNMLSNVNNYNLVIYSDENSSGILKPYLQNPRIKLVLKPVEDFYGYKYKEYWEKNHMMNPHLTSYGVVWQVNMLWSEKIHFVKQSAEKKYFESEWYGWCDIGYFRARSYLDLQMDQLEEWPNPEKLSNLDTNKIHYGRPALETQELVKLWSIIRDKNNIGLPKVQIPPDQVSIAGGFFILHKNKIDWWRETFDAKLRLYFENNYLVKDDQMIIADCIFSDDGGNFWVHCENKPPLDNWFMFQRLLL